MPRQHPIPDFFTPLKLTQSPSLVTIQECGLNLPMCIAKEIYHHRFTRSVTSLKAVSQLQYHASSSRRSSPRCVSAALVPQFDSLYAGILRRGCEVKSRAISSWKIEPRDLPFWDMHLGASVWMARDASLVFMSFAATLDLDQLNERHWLNLAISC